MAKMTEMELLAVLNPAMQDAAIFNGEFSALNAKYLKEYLGRPYGDEVEGQSSVVSTDVADVVESDMPSLARIFLGSGDIISFEPNTENEAEVQEAEDKSKYVNWIIRNQPNSFATIHNWLKDAEIQKNGVVKYFIDESKEVETHEYEGVDQTEFAGIVESLKGADVDKVKVEVADQIEDEQTGLFNISFRSTKECNEVRIINVPPESFLITKNASSIDDASLVGDRIRKTRGELIADGFKRDLVDQLPSIGDEEQRETTIADIRNREQGGSTKTSSDIKNWSSETVEVKDLYVKVDFDGDGIAERRHVMISGNKVLINEPFDHVPYASLSAILMPHKAIGRSRAEIVSSTQRQKTALLRGMLNNQYMVNNPRNVVHPDVDLDDMLDARVNGIVRLEEDTEIRPQDAVYPLTVPYIGGESLQVLQYVDQARAQTTGAMLANQGLDSDAIGRETATRFEGVQDAAAAKIELIARNYAETGFRKLYEGIAWLVSRYQNTDAEFRVLGKAMTVNPANWRYKHHVQSNVGLGAGNNERLIESLQGIYGIQMQLKDKQSLLVDDKDMFNTLSRITDGLGLPRTNEFFNDPEVPDETLLAQNEQLNQMVMQLQEQVQMMQNPLADAEKIKQEAFLLKAQSDAQIKTTELAMKQQQFETTTAQQQEQFESKTAEKLTELEMKYKEDAKEVFDGNLDPSALSTEQIIAALEATNNG